MFSPDFMRFLINYQKPDKAEIESQKEIKFKDNDKGGLAYVILMNKYAKKRAFFMGSRNVNLYSFLVMCEV